MSEGKAQGFFQQFNGPDGPIESIQVFHYEAGTTTPKDIWSDPYKQNALPQPFVGDSMGWLRFFGDGDYKLVFTDSDGCEIIQIDNFRLGTEVALINDGSNGTSLPSPSTLNNWHLFAKHSGTGEFEGLYINDGEKYLPITGAVTGGTFHVATYGATGNGTSDDTTAIQAAYNAAKDAGGGCVQFGIGDYRVTSQINVNHDILTKGCGFNTRIKADFTGSYVFHYSVPGRRGFKSGMRDLVIDCDSTVDYGLFIDSWFAGHWSDIHIVNPVRHGLHITSNQQQDSAGHLFQNINTFPEGATLGDHLGVCFVEAGTAGRMTDSTFDTCSGTRVSDANLPGEAWCYDFLENSRVSMVNCRGGTGPGRHFNGLVRWRTSTEATKAPKAGTPSTHSGGLRITGLYCELNNSSEEEPIGVLLESNRTDGTQINNCHIEGVFMQPGRSTVLKCVDNEDGRFIRNTMLIFPQIPPDLDTNQLTPSTTIVLGTTATNGPINTYIYSKGDDQDLLTGLTDFSNNKTKYNDWSLVPDDTPLVVGGTPSGPGVGRFHNVGQFQTNPADGRIWTYGLDGVPRNISSFTCLERVEGWMDFSDANTNIGSIPGNSVIDHVLLFVDDAFDGSGTIAIGTSNGGAERLAATSVTSAGPQRVNATENGAFDSSNQPTWVTVGGSPTQGRVHVSVFYTRITAEP